MPTTEILSVFDATRIPAQAAFINSKAVIRGYGGAMGGGKSRTGCEVIFDACLDHPGLVAVVARQAHTSIINTTKRTMLTQVIPAALITNEKKSGGEDYIELWNGSIIHFIGLDDPLRWFSSEIGYAFFDEAQEIQEDTVVRIISRLRQPCAACVALPVYEMGLPVACPHMPCKAIITFNPSSPGHWLEQWFLAGAQRTKHGFRKDELFPTDAEEPIADCEFVKALAVHNPFLGEQYMKFLRGMPSRMRKKYLDGEWVYESGNQFFDPEDLGFHSAVCHDAKPLTSGHTVGDVEKDFLARRRGAKPDDPIKVRKGEGGLTVWKAPKKDPRERYVVAVDSSSGQSKDWAAIQVVSIESFEQVAELQQKLTPAQTAVEAYRLGRIYNDATIVPELTGGWGFAVQQELQRMHYPALYTRKVLDRLTRKWTDKLGFDTTEKTRAHILGTLERVISEREFVLNSLRAHQELSTFVINDKGKAEAQIGCNDDLVMALAIAVTIALEQPRKREPLRQERYAPLSTATGY